MRSLGVVSVLGLLGIGACGGAVAPDDPPARTSAALSSRVLTTCTASDQQNDPAISGSRVVFTRVVDSGSRTFDIAALDLSSSAPPLNITTSPGEQEFLEALDGDRLVYTHTSASIAGDIVYYDFASNRFSVIASATLTKHYENPALGGGHYAVLTSVEASKSDIFLYDFDFGPIRVTDDDAIENVARTDGSFVVYRRSDGSGVTSFMAWPIATSGPPFVVADATGEDTMGDIDGGIVVYSAAVGASVQIFLFDTTTRTTSQLTTAPGVKHRPRISGGRVVWGDQRAGDFDVYGYDIAARLEVAVATGAGDQYIADIQGDQVVYTTNEGGCEHVALATFPPSPPPPPNVASTDADVESLFASGQIKNAGIENALLSKLAAAAAKRAAGDCAGAAAIYNAFINSVNAQTGKGITSSAAAILIADAQYLITHCP
jgi:beta propeller repeat protein